MKRVILAYPDDGGTREVLLVSIPRKGEHVRIANGPGASVLLVVESITWVEGAEKPPEPTVIVAVRPRA